MEPRKGIGKWTVILAVVVLAASLLLLIGSGRTPILRPVVQSLHAWWKLSRAGGIMTEPWKELTADAVWLGEDVLSHQGSLLSVFRLDATSKTYQAGPALTLKEFIHRIVVLDRTAYVTIGRLGVAVVEIGTGNELKKIRESRVRGYAFDLSLNSHVLGVAAREGGFSLLDVSSPADPRAICQRNTDGPAHGIAVGKDTVWVSVGGVGVLPFDRQCREKGSPLVSEKFNEEATLRPEPPPFDIVVWGRDLLYAAGKFGLEFHREKSSVTQAVELGLPVAEMRAVGSGDDLVCWGDFAGTAGVARWEDEPEGFGSTIRLRPLSNVRVGGTPVHVSCGGGRMLLAEGAQGFSAFDISDPLRPLLTGKFHPRPIGHHLASVEPYLILSRGSGGAEIYEVTAGTAPRLVGKIPARGSVQHVSGLFPTVYVSEVTGGFSVWDISSPAAPVLLDERIVPFHGRQSARVGTDLFVVTGEAPVVNFELGRGRKLHDREHITHPGYGWRISKGRGRVFVGLLYAGVGEIKLGDGPSRRIEKLEEVETMAPTALLVSDPYLYVGDLVSGVTAYDLRTSPMKRAGEFRGAGIPYALERAGDRLYIAAHAEGLGVAELRDGIPTGRGKVCPVGDRVLGVLDHAGRLFLSGAESGLIEWTAEMEKACEAL